MTHIEGDDNDGFAKGKGDGTSTGAAASNSNGGSGKPQSNNCGRLNGGGTSTKVKARSRGSEKNDGKDSSDADAATANRFIDKSPSTEKSCLHCGESLLHGQRVTLHECACGKFYHHLCAGRLDHTEFATCYDCYQQSKQSEVPVVNASASDRRSVLKKALDTLSEAHKSLLTLSSEVELCSRSESKQKKQEFDEACEGVKDNVVSAYQAWFQSKSPPPAQTKELQHLLKQVLVLVKGTRQFSEIDFVRKKVQGKN